MYNARGLVPDQRILDAMAARLAHRGPDAGGCHIDRCVQLASRRLSVIDPDAAAQPLFTPDGRYCIVYNGEVYNYRALRAELADEYRFTTHTDTEVVLAAYATWGLDCLERLQGMFAFAIWDDRQQQLLLVRDRFGIKPLYVTRLADHTLLFGSEIKVFTAHPQFQARMRAPALDNLLTYGFTVAPHTFFEGVEQVLPGHWVSLHNNTLRQHCYWDIDLSRPLLNLPEAELAEQVRAQLAETVRSSLVADVPVGAYLSGGIDSSTVTALYAQVSPDPVTALTITFEGGSADESGYAGQVARACGCRHVVFPCRIDADTISHLVYHLENPLVSLLNLPLYLLAERTRAEGIKVVLTGDGADEVLGGYDYFKQLKCLQFIERGSSGWRQVLLRHLYPDSRTPASDRACCVQLRNDRERFPLLHPAMPYQFRSYPHREQLFAPELRDRLAQAGPDNPFYFNPRAVAGRPLLDQAVYMDIKMRLLCLTLPLADKMGMAHGVETRPVLLDHRLVELVFQLPHHCRMRGLDEKHILKRAMRDLLPPDICARRKQPLTPPPDWFISAAGDLLRCLLSPVRLRDTGYFNPAFVGQALAAYDTGNGAHFADLLVVVFFVQLWDALFLRNGL